MQTSYILDNEYSSITSFAPHVEERLKDTESRIDPGSTPTVVDASLLTPLQDMFTPNANKVPAVTTLSKQLTTSKRLPMTMESSFKSISQTMEAPSPAKNSELA